MKEATTTALPDFAAETYSIMTSNLKAMEQNGKWLR